jgi:hypothetical protein
MTLVLVIWDLSEGRSAHLSCPVSLLYSSVLVLLYSKRMTAFVLGSVLIDPDLGFFYHPQAFLREVLRRKSND